MFTGVSRVAVAPGIEPRDHWASPLMLAHRLIERKRDGGRIEAGEWRAFILAYAAGHVPDYQMSSFLMACFIRGLDRTELGALTDVMLLSGSKLDFTGFSLPRIDKHSTGGVGDTVALHPP